jgi:Domain of unknown function (DUF4864)
MASMSRWAFVLILVPLLIVDAYAGDAEIESAQKTIDAQLKAFSRGDNSTAYSYAGPSIQRIFPTLDSFMSMVTGAYQPVYKPRSYSFGKVEEMGAAQIIQQVLVVGPDGKDYEAVYTLELQPDGQYKIIGVSLRASNSLST